ncbi:hypothetical protein C8R45DRAFT_1029561 [Mycena sanguinolenta]|nr:hypothetical protein C8R45DRAFT_1029561 [Mycena sanguinolenta]
MHVYFSLGYIHPDYTRTTRPTQHAHRVLAPIRGHSRLCPERTDLAAPESVTRIKDAGLDACAPLLPLSLLAAVCRSYAASQELRSALRGRAVAGRVRKHCMHRHWQALTVASHLCTRCRSTAAPPPMCTSKRQAIRTGGFPPLEPIYPHPMYLSIQPNFFPASFSFTPPSPHRPTMPYSDHHWLQIPLIRWPVSKRTRARS